MKTYERVYIYNNKEYKVVITKKAIRSVNYRLKGDVFSISCPIFYSIDNCMKNLSDIGPRLIRRVEKRSNKEKPITDEYIYIFGEKYPRTDFPNDSEMLEKVLKRLLLEKVTKLTRINEEKMNIKVPYKVTVRKMSTRWGSNAYNTHHITYALNLVHYSEEIIESVVIHELCHDKYRDHQKGFYNEYSYYCPAFKEFRYKITKGIYK